MKSQLTAALFYTVVILGAMLYSSAVSEKTLYNRYLVQLAGVVIPVSEIKKATAFYTNVLDFPAARLADAGSQPAFELPGRRFLLLEEAAGPGELRTITAMIRVRNGLTELQTQLQQRSGAPEHSLLAGRDQCDQAPGSVSAVARLKGKDEFVVTDPDGNCIIFVQKRLAALNRFK